MSIKLLASARVSSEIWYRRSSGTRIRNRIRPSAAPLARNSSCMVLTIGRSRSVRPLPICLPTMMEAAVHEPTAVTFSSRNMVEEIE